jgi:hypothetical protein
MSNNINLHPTSFLFSIMDKYHQSILFVCSYPNQKLIITNSTDKICHKISMNKIYTYKKFLILIFKLYD